MDIASIVQLGLAGSISVAVVTFLMKLAWSQHKVVSNHLHDFKEVIRDLSDAIKEEAAASRELREYLRGKDQRD